MSLRDDKESEKNRYDRRSESLLTNGSVGSWEHSQHRSQREWIVEPYLFFDSLVKRRCTGGLRVLEIGAGTAAMSASALSVGANVIATDISYLSMQFVLRAERESAQNLSAVVADMELLPFQDGTIDVVLSAGSLSYGDNALVMCEILRVLRSGGVFICIDSLNHNPIYRINRRIHFLRGERTRGTLVRMPSISLINQYQKMFGVCNVSYFGALTWLMPAIAGMLGHRRAARLSSCFDRALRIRRSAFKFVMEAQKSF